MKKFKFPLESVLKVRGLHKKVAEREVSQTQSRLNRTHQDLVDTQVAYRDSFHVSNPDAGNLAFWNTVTSQYQAGLLDRRKRLEERRDKLVEELAVQKKELTRRMKEERVIEKLKEHMRDEHAQLVDAEFQREIEEIDVLKRGQKK